MNYRASIFVDPTFCRSNYVQTETKNGMVKYPLSFEQSHSQCRGSPVANGRQRVKRQCLLPSLTSNALSRFCKVNPNSVK